MNKSILSFLMCIVIVMFCLSACTQVHTHNLIRHEAKIATCLELGNLEYYECTDCGKLFGDSEGKDKLSSKDVKIPATGHSYSDSWSSDAEYHWHAADCGHSDLKDKAAHTFTNDTCSECGAYNGQASTVLEEAATPQPLSHDESSSQNLADILQSANTFANRLSELVFNNYAKEDNFTIAPISVYMALSIAAECAAANTREEILSALGVTHEQLNNSFIAASM